MAFDSLHGQKVVSDRTGEMFIFSDYFAVYNNTSDNPFVYRWDEIEEITETPSGMTFKVSENTYFVPYSSFTSNAHLLVSRAIIEGQIANNPEISYKTLHRILPIKSNYRKIGLSDTMYSGTGKYCARDINSGYAAMQSSKLSKFLWVIGLVVAIVFFFSLYIFFAEIEDNWPYYVLIAALGGTIISTLLFIIFSLVSKLRFKDYQKLDRATDEEILFIVSADGFAAIEKCAYAEGELIPWSRAELYYETKYTYVVILKDKSFLWLPKQVFEKSAVSAISSFIVSHIH